MKCTSIVILSLICLSVLVSCTEGYEIISGFAQGGTYTVRYSKPSFSNAREIRTSLEEVITAVDNSISGYNRGSILSRVNGGEDVCLDSIFINVFSISKKIWEISDGAFDPSAGALFNFWGYGFESGEKDENMIPGILGHIGMNLFELEETEEGTFLRKTDTLATLNFNAIAQGYTCDLMADVLDAYGCDDYIIELGGEIVCKGRSSRGDDWRIWIDKPLEGNNVSGALKQDVLSITDCGVVTSGNYRKFYYENGEKYSHTIDPRTGYPVRHSLLSATVLAEDGTSADAYATWFMVVGPEEAQRLASELGVGVYLVYGDQENMKVWHTEGLVLDEEIK